MKFNKFIRAAFQKNKTITKSRSSKYQHFSFLTLNSKIISIGWNDTGKTHPISAKYGYRYCALHSEVHCIIKSHQNFLDRKGLVLVNIQLRKGTRLTNSEPCELCKRFLYDYGIEHIYFSNQEGNFGYLNLLNYFN